MDSTEQIEHRARMRYESARLRRALIGFTPALVVVALAAIFSKRPSSAVAFGLAMFAVGTVLLWYGRDLKRAVLPGVAAGLVPLALVLCANHVKHMCMGGACLMLCVPACTVGGIAAGLVVAGIGVRRKSGIGFWLSASAIALLTGSMGCSCIGYAGVAGLALGLGVGVMPGLVRRIVARQPRHNS